MARDLVNGDNFVVAHATRLAPRIPHWQLFNGHHGGGAIVTSFAECWGQEKMPGGDKCPYEHSKDDEQALELLGHEVQT
jgi:hypothetical protein